jgi:hypothetical protein
MGHYTLTKESSETSVREKGVTCWKESKISVNYMGDPLTDWLTNSSLVIVSKDSADCMALYPRR